MFRRESFYQESHQHFAIYYDIKKLNSDLNGDITKIVVLFGLMSSMFATMKNVRVV